MSDLGELWQAGAGNAKENFTTAALKIAIKHDCRPMVIALTRLNWPNGPTLAPVDRIDPDHQWTLFGPNSAGMLTASEGRLDLVLAGTIAGTPTWEVWVEVKIDALESGKQLETYERHWLSEHPSKDLRLAVLGPRRLKAKRADGTEIPVAWLPWTAIVSAIGAVNDAHGSWTDLRDFLGEQWIAHPTTPGDPEEGEDAILQVLWKVNELMRQHKAEDSMWWPSEKQMRLNALGRRESGLGITTTGANLVYGLKSTRDGWDWTVGADRTLTLKYGHFESGEADARAAMLDASWQRSSSGRLLVERMHQHTDMTAGPEALAWLVESIDQLRAASLVLPRR
jgi:hypothetical protein